MLFSLFNQEDFWASDYAKKSQYFWEIKTNSLPHNCEDFTIGAKVKYKKMKTQQSAIEEKVGFFLSLEGLSFLRHFRHRLSCFSPYPWSSTGGLSEEQIRKFVLKYWEKKFWYISHHFFSKEGQKSRLCLGNFSIFFSKKAMRYLYAIWPTSLIPISTLKEYLKETDPKFEDWFFRQSFFVSFFRVFLKCHTDKDLSAKEEDGEGGSMGKPFRT